MSAALLLSVTALAVATATQTANYTVATPTRIMALGDSITRGGGSSWGQGYRLPLIARMISGRYASDMVGAANSGPPWVYDRNHAGYGGHGIDDIKALAAAQLNAYQPHYVLLMAGSNDVQWDYELDTAPDRLGALIDVISSTVPNARVVVASIPPLRDAVQDARARAYNSAIPGIVQARAAAGKPVYFVDMYPLLTLDDLADNVHPNDSGYAKLSHAWAETLEALRALPPAVSARVCPCSMWSPADAPITAQVDTTTAAEVGVKFRTEKDGFITGVRFYKGPDNAGPHEARLWKAISDPSTWNVHSTTMTADLLASGSVTSEGGGGWQVVTFATPVPVQAHVLYFATYYAPFGRYAADPGYFRDREIVHSPVRLPSQGSVDGNGFINVGGPGLPQPSAQSDTNYWVDVVFSPPSPPAPSALATAVSATRIDVTWSTVQGATSYRLQRSLNAAHWIAVDGLAPGANGHSDTNLAPEATYYYRVFAVADGALSAPSATVSATTRSAPAPVPPAPSSVTATAVSSTQIDVAWSDVAGETSYRVERSVPGGTWSTVTSVAANATSYADTGLGPATTYSYRVVALNAAGGSPASPSGTATTLGDSIPPTAPTGLKAVSPKGKINLSWVASTDSGGSGLARYRIWRRSGASAAPVEIGTTATTAYSDGSVRPSVDYFYQVTAVDGAGNESQPSNVVSARSK